MLKYAAKEHIYYTLCAKRWQEQLFSFYSIEIKNDPKY